MLLRALRWFRSRTCAFPAKNICCEDVLSKQQVGALNQALFIDLKQTVKRGLISLSEKKTLRGWRNVVYEL